MLRHFSIASNDALATCKPLGYLRNLEFADHPVTTIESLTGNCLVRLQQQFNGGRNVGDVHGLAATACFDALASRNVADHSIPL